MRKLLTLTIHNRCKILKPISSLLSMKIIHL